MTREIKFKGKRLDNGEWAYGDLIQTPESTSIFWTEPYSGSWQEKKVKIDPSTVSQYTGLQDDKDEEIYEGDIVRDEYEGIAKVHFDSYAWRLIYGIGDDDDQVQSFEELDCLRMAVIGNIHDNPELLK